MLPWDTYHYAEFNNTSWLNEGIQLGGSEGSQAAFLVIRNPPNPGGWSGFGIQYVFDQDWALPGDPSYWKNYTFSADFKEQVGLPCRIELQVKSPDTPPGVQHLLWYTNYYSFNVGNDGWMTVSNSLDQFVEPDFGRFFDSAHVHSIVVNIAMLQTDTVYVGMFDNIRFEGPDVDLGGGQALTGFSSVQPPAGLYLVRDPGGWVAVGWSGGGTLESAEGVEGPWQTVTNATNPTWIEPVPEQQYFRVRRAP